uniref:mannose-binding protein-like n=1 Tax=Styela clava TaxID=7725 RepID=UPI00193999D0|nr:mannose-binding protein-like [Styela clava]
MFLESCSITCKENDDSGISMPREQRVLGYPGKRGPVGLPGPPGPAGIKGAVGPPGANCDCKSQGTDIEARLSALEKAIKEIRGETVSPEVNELQSTGWYKASNGLWYKVHYDKMKYAEAKTACKEEGARLASTGLRDPTVHGEILSLFNLTDGDYIFIGLDDIKTQNVWIWSDGVKSTRSNTPWKKGQPNKANQRCADINKDGKIFDDKCKKETYFLCEKEL